MTTNKLDNKMYTDIAMTYVASVQLKKLKLITPYQQKMIQKWLFTSTKKAERILNE